MAALKIINNISRIIKFLQILRIFQMLFLGVFSKQLCAFLFDIFTVNCTMAVNNSFNNLEIFAFEIRRNNAPKTYNQKKSFLGMETVEAMVEVAAVDLAVVAVDGVGPAPDPRGGRGLPAG